MLQEAEFETIAASTLDALMLALEPFEDEIDAELSGGILTLEFSDGSRYLLNSHRAARQIWMAADRVAWHFDFDPARRRWRAQKTNDELWAALSAALSSKLQQTLVLTPPQQA